MDNIRWINIAEKIRNEAQRYSESFEHSGIAKQSFVNGCMWLISLVENNKSTEETQPREQQDNLRLI